MAKEVAQKDKNRYVLWLVISGTAVGLYGIFQVVMASMAGAMDDPYVQGQVTAPLLGFILTWWGIRYLKKNKIQK